MRINLIVTFSPTQFSIHPVLRRETVLPTLIMATPDSMEEIVKRMKRLPSVRALAIQKVAVK